MNAKKADRATTPISDPFAKTPRPWRREGNLIYDHDGHIVCNVFARALTPEEREWLAEEVMQVVNNRKDLGESNS